MIIVDVETSGLVVGVHSILSIGAVYFYNPEEYFYGECKLPEWAEYDEKALKVNGFSLEEIKDKRKQSLDQLLLTFFDWVKNFEERVLAGNNVSFEIF